jgi:hypothetical protein
MKAKTITLDGVIHFEGGMTIDLDELLGRVIKDLDDDKQSQSYLLELLYRQLPALRASLFEQHPKTTTQPNNISAAG